MRTREIELASIYKHFKRGDLYYTMNTGFDSERDESNVIYHALYGDKEIHVKPLSEFLEEVEEGRDNPFNQKYKYELVEEMEEMGTIVVVMDEGNLQRVLTTTTVAVCVVDFDVDGLDEDESTKFLGKDAYVYKGITKSEVEPEEIELILNDIQKAAQSILYTLDHLQSLDRAGLLSLMEEHGYEDGFEELDDQALIDQLSTIVKG